MNFHTALLPHRPAPQPEAQVLDKIAIKSNRIESSAPLRVRRARARDHSQAPRRRVIPSVRVAAPRGRPPSVNQKSGFELAESNPPRRPTRSCQSQDRRDPSPPSAICDPRAGSHPPSTYRTTASPLVDGRQLGRNEKRFTTRFANGDQQLQTPTSPTQTSP